MFILSKKACFLTRTSPNTFSGCLLHKTKGVTRAYKGLQGVTGGYKGLQGVTGGDKGLQGVTKDYRNFFLTRTYPDTFSWSILHKN